MWRFSFIIIGAIPNCPSSVRLQLPSSSPLLVAALTAFQLFSNCPWCSYYTKCTVAFHKMQRTTHLCYMYTGMIGHCIVCTGQCAMCSVQCSLCSVLSRSALSWWSSTQSIINPPPSPSQPIVGCVICFFFCFPPKFSHIHARSNLIIFVGRNFKSPLTFKVQNNWINILNRIQNMKKCRT